MKKLVIISNESTFENDGKYFCDNLDMKSTPEGLSKYYEINLIARKSNKVRSHEIKVKNIKICNSFFTFLFQILRLVKVHDSKFLLVSISPYTFLACIFLRLFGKKPIVYLRSDGYGEYKVILGFIGPIIYHLMFTIVSKISHLISCRDYILKGKKGSLVSPSQLNSSWLSNIKTPSFEDIKLLFIGRIRKEKGIFSLVKLIESLQKISLTIVGAEKNSKEIINQNNVNIYEIESKTQNLIKYYDDHNIFILPSFTEGYPMSLIEALARRRPVIIFEEIKHVVGDKKGIFVSKRNSNNLIETINYIQENILEIQEEMKKNHLPTNDDFIKEMSDLIFKFN
tara:strand:+ start:1763 stop:2782 length:1020 start_codon:yes stop_codon:yes gene_type:complete